MVTQANSGDKLVVPKNLRTAFRTIQWDLLEPPALFILSRGAMPAHARDMYYLANCLASLPGAHKPRIVEALSLWTVSNKTLVGEVRGAVGTAFKVVFGQGVKRMTNLTGLEQRIFNAMCELQPALYEEFQVSYASLGISVKSDTRNIIRAVKSMVDKGVLEIAPAPVVKGQKGRRINFYRIVEPKD